MTRDLPWPCVVGVPEFCAPDRFDLVLLLLSLCAWAGVFAAWRVERRWRKRVGL